MTTANRVIKVLTAVTGCLLLATACSEFEVKKYMSLEQKCAKFKAQLTPEGENIIQPQVGDVSATSVTKEQSEKDRQEALAKEQQERLEMMKLCKMTDDQMNPQGQTPDPNNTNQVIPPVKPTPDTKEEPGPKDGTETAKLGNDNLDAFIGGTTESPKTFADYIADNMSPNAAEYVLGLEGIRGVEVDKSEELKKSVIEVFLKIYVLHNDKKKKIVASGETVARDENDASQKPDEYRSELTINEMTDENNKVPFTPKEDLDVYAFCLGIDKECKKIGIQIRFRPISKDNDSEVSVSLILAMSDAEGDKNFVVEHSTLGPVGENHKTFKQAIDEYYRDFCKTVDKIQDDASECPDEEALRQANEILENVHSDDAAIDKAQSIIDKINERRNAAAAGKNSKNHHPADTVVETGQSGATTLVEPVAEVVVQEESGFTMMKKRGAEERKARAKAQAQAEELGGDGVISDQITEQQILAGQSILGEIPPGDAQIEKAKNVPTAAGEENKKFDGHPGGQE